MPVPAAAAPSKSPAAAPVVDQVVACQSIADGVQRLACFDRQVAAMARAQASGDLVSMDRQQVRRTKRSLFGIALPDLGAFGGNEIAGEESQLETTIKSARQNADGKWTFDLAEGGRWAQIDSRDFVVDPKSGHPIRIRRAAMGSYLANVNKQVAIRVRRIQ
jgi:hypothetical protein